MKIHFTRISSIKRKKKGRKKAKKKIDSSISCLGSNKRVEDKEVSRSECASSSVETGAQGGELRSGPLDGREQSKNTWKEGKEENFFGLEVYAVRGENSNPFRRE